MSDDDNGENLPQPRPQITPDQLERLLDRTETEFQIRAKELEDRELELENQRENNQQIAGNASHGADLQLQDRNNIREFALKSQAKRYVFIGLIVAVVIGFMVFLVATKETALVEKLIQLGAVFIGGGGAGYLLRGKTTQPQQPPTN